MTAPSAEDLDRWVDAAAREDGLGIFALVAHLSGADDPEVARLLLAAAGRRLAAGKPLPDVLGRWVGERLQAATARADGSALPVVGRGEKPPAERTRTRDGRLYRRIEALRAEGCTRDKAIEQAAREARLSFDRAEALYKQLRRASLKPTEVIIDG